MGCAPHRAPACVAPAGPIPDPQWTSVGFATPCTLRVRPGNEPSAGGYKEPGLCGERKRCAGRFCAARAQRLQSQGCGVCTRQLSPQNALPRHHATATAAGPLLALNPKLFDPQLILNPTQDIAIDKPLAGSLANSTTLVVRPTCSICQLACCTLRKHAPACRGRPAGPTRRLLPALTCGFFLRTVACSRRSRTPTCSPWAAW